MADLNPELNIGGIGELEADALSALITVIAAVDAVPLDVGELERAPLDLAELARWEQEALVAVMEYEPSVMLAELAGWEAGALAAVAGGVDSGLCVVVDPAAGGDTACAECSQPGSLLPGSEGLSCCLRCASARREGAP